MLFLWFTYLWSTLSSVYVGLKCAGWGSLFDKFVKLKQKQEHDFVDFKNWVHATKNKS